MQFQDQHAALSMWKVYIFGKENVFGYHEIN